MALDNIVENNHSRSLIKKAFNTCFNIAAASAATLLSAATLGNMGIIVGSFMAAGGAIAGITKRKSSYKIVNDALKRYATLNTILYPVISIGRVTFTLIPNYTLLGKGLRALYGSFALVPAFIASFRTVYHLIDKKFNPKGLANHLREDFYEMWKRMGKIFFPAYALIGNGISYLPFPYFGSIHSFTPSAAIAGYVNEKYPIHKQRRIYNDLPRYKLPAVA